MPYTKQHNLLSYTSSTATGAPVFVGDASTLAVSLQTVTTASTYTIQGSNDDGFTVAIVNWSTVSTLTATGIYAIQPGMRWLRAQQAASNSSATLRLSQQVAI